MARSDVRARVLVAIPLIVLAAVIVAVGGPLFAVGMFAIGALCMDELFRMLDRTHPAKLAGFAALAGLLVAAYLGSELQIMLVALLALPLTFLTTAVMPRGSAGGIAATMLAVWWIGVPFAHAVLLRDLPHGGAILFDVLVGTFVGDTGAYFGGRAFGRRPLAPRISPKKTLEGLLIGMLSAVIGVWFASLYQDNVLRPGNALLLGLAVAVAAPIGDLFESYLKRDVGAKDSGTLLRAHGGVLDRLDAVLFTVVVGYFVWNAML